MMELEVAVEGSTTPAEIDTAQILETTAEIADSVMTEAEAEAQRRRTFEEMSGSIADGDTDLTSRVPRIVCTVTQASRTAARTARTAAQTPGTADQALSTAAQASPTATQTPPTEAQTHLTAAQTSTAAAQAPPTAAQTSPIAAQDPPAAAQAPATIVATTSNPSTQTVEQVALMQDFVRQVEQFLTAQRALLPRTSADQTACQSWLDAVLSSLSALSSPVQPTAPPTAPEQVTGLASTHPAEHGAVTVMRQWMTQRSTGLSRTQLAERAAPMAPTAQPAQPGPSIRPPQPLPARHPEPQRPAQPFQTPRQAVQTHPEPQRRTFASVARSAPDTPAAAAALLSRRAPVSQRLPAAGRTLHSHSQQALDELRPVYVQLRSRFDISELRQAFRCFGDTDHPFDGRELLWFSYFGPRLAPVLEILCISETVATLLTSRLRHASSQGYQILTETDARVLLQPTPGVDPSTRSRAESAFISRAAHAILSTRSWIVGAWFQRRVHYLSRDIDRQVQTLSQRSAPFGRSAASRT